jgi:hypothetical protein
MVTNPSENVKSILAKNPAWQATYRGLVQSSIPVVLLSVICSTCNHDHIVCLADEERSAYLFSDGNEFVRICSRCGESLTFCTGTVLLKR